METIKSIFDFDEITEKKKTTKTMWCAVPSQRTMARATAISRYVYLHTTLQHSFYASIIWKEIFLSLTFARVDVVVFMIVVDAL